MTALPPVLVLFDLNALLTGKTRDWRDCARVGDCYVPRVVLEEVEFLCNRAAESEVERSAREFSRFYADSGWHSSISIASHPALKPTEGHASSQKARLSLSVAQTAYGLSRNHPEALVVLVTHDQSLMRRLRLIDAPNLCGIPMAALLQWSRTLRRPAVVSTQLQTLRSSPMSLSQSTGMSRVGHLSPKSTSALRSTTTVARRAPGRRAPAVAVSWLNQAFFNLVTLSLLTIVSLGMWRVVEPVSFNQFWRHLPFIEQR